MITLNQPKSDSAPLSNTGLDSHLAQNSSLSVKPDWIQGTFRFATLDDLHLALNFVQEYTNERWVYFPGRGRFCGKQWNNSVQGINKAIALYNLPSEEGGQLGHCFLSFPATALNGIDIRDIWRMMLGLTTIWHFKTTRFDVALDDYAKRITYEMLDEAARNKNYTGFKNAPTVHHSYDKTGQIVGWTFSFGNRLCDRVFRAYDKATESEGEIDSVRLEAEFHDTLAQQVVANWIQIPPERFDDASPKYLAKVVVGCITFIERTKDKNISRMAVLDWWQQILDEVGTGIRHTVKAVKTTLEQKKEWITRQVSTQLAMFSKIMGMKEFFSYLKAELKGGQDRFTDYHLAFIDHYKNDSLLR